MRGRREGGGKKATGAQVHRHMLLGKPFVERIIRTTTDGDTTMMKNHPHPGELLREDVLLPLGIEVTDAANRLDMSRTTLSRAINGRAGISPDLAIRL